jgi:hypothetical protein
MVTKPWGAQTQSRAESAPFAGRSNNCTPRGWVDRIVGLEGVRVEFAMMETPDGHGRLELVKFHAPRARGRPARAGEHPGPPPSRIRSRRHRRRRRWLASPRRGTRWRGGELRRHLSALLGPRPRGDHRRVGGADRLRAPAGRQPPRQRQWSSRGRIPIRHTPGSIDPLASWPAMRGRSITPRTCFEGILPDGLSFDGLQSRQPSKPATHSSDRAP